MRRVAMGLVAVGVAGFALIGWADPPMGIQAQQPAAPLTVAPAVKPLVLSDGLIALSSDTAAGQQQVAVIDSKTRVMSVYHIDHQSGVIALKSVRNLSADLMMDEFNTESPLPREIRAIISKR